MKEGKITAPGPCQEPETTTLQSVACGAMGGEPTAVDVKNGKIVRMRPYHIDEKYPQEKLENDMWSIEVDGQVFRPEMKAAPNYFALAYKNRVYSKNRVLYPLKRIDWEPGGDPAKINAQNRGKSKFKRISWDEAIDIIESELRRVIEQYGPYTVLCIGEDGHRESKDIHAGGGQNSNLMDKLGGYTRETRTPDSVEGWYWGAKHIWGSGSDKGLGLPAPPQNGYNNWNTVRDMTLNTELVAFDAGDWELTQNYASQFWSRLLKYWEKIGKEFVIVDPFCNYTAVCHDGMKWIPILPNTDAAFDFGIMYTWIDEGTYDKEYVATHTVGFEQVKAYIMGDEDGIPKTPAWAAERCGVPEWTIKAYARQTAKKVTSMAHFSSGAIKGPYSHEQGRTGAYKLAMQGLGGPGRQILFMNAATMAKSACSHSACGPFMSVSQARRFIPTVQTVPRTQVAQAIQNGKLKWWGSPAIVYVKTEEQFQEYNYPAPAEEGGTPLHLLWSEKPCNMACWNGGFNYQDALRSDEVECFITNHQWIENDSLFADIILPVSTCLEERDIMGASMLTSSSYAAITEKAIEPMGESMSDFEIAIEIGKRFGVEDQISLGMDIDEWVKYAYDKSRIKDEITWEELSEKKYYFPKTAEGYEDIKPGLGLFYDDPEENPLDTPTGKLELYSRALADNFPDDKERGPIAKWVIGGSPEDGWTHDETLWGEKCKTYPLLITANPARFRVHVQGDDIVWYREIETVKVKGPDGYSYEPIWFAPEDAEARGIKNGDIVKLFNDQGTILVGARISQRVVPGAVIVNKGSRVDPIAPHLDRGGSTNLICPPRPISQHCYGFVVTGYLVEAQKLEQAEMDQWKKDYPDAFARDYDPAVGLNYKSWVVE